MTTVMQLLRTTPSFAELRAASDASSRAKKANRAKDTRHEVLLRKELWRLGIRYRKHYQSVPGTPDIAFPSDRLAVFCDGDFWHGRNWSRLRAKLSRRANPAYWVAKIESNRSRDARTRSHLGRLGWKIVRLWETDILSDPTAAAEQIIQMLTERRRRAPNPTLRSRA